MIHRHVTTARRTDYASDGIVRLAPLTCWMQEAAAAASEAAGITTSRLDALGCSWVVYELHLRVAQSRPAPGEVQVETWVLPFTTYRSPRQYRLTTLQGAPLAVAAVEWAMVGSGGYPVRIPDEVRQAYPVGEAPALESVLDLPRHTVPQGALSTTRLVRRGDIDRAQHANHSRYLDWIEDHLAQLTGDLWFGAPEAVSIRFGKGAFLGETVSLYTRAREVRGDLVELEHLGLTDRGPVLRAASVRRFDSPRECAAWQDRALRPATPGDQPGSS